MTRPGPTFSRAVVVALAAAAVVVAAVARAQHFDAAPTHAQLQERFAELRAAKTLRVDRRLRWEYRFSSPDVRALEALSVLLVADDYKIATLLPPHEGAPAATLRVVRVEQHTPDSLEQRSAELRRRATVQGAAYDGVDVGRPD
ncbi:MAG TPA: hypothetical protein VE907_00555 [Gammaproteobacteria bacterium]|nr:hypothetical protein [Gammaproteobacteria bacterium]